MSIEHLISYQPQSLRWRRRLIVSVMLLAALAILIRLTTVQVFERQRWLALGEQQYRARIRISGERGIIRDRNGTVLATSVATISFALDPKMARSTRAIVETLARLGLANSEQLMARIAVARDRNFVWLVRGIPLDIAARLDSLGDPGLIRIREMQRAYVLDSLAAQVIGTTDLDGHGIAGIELEYDSLLQGTSGERIMERIGRGRLRPLVSDPGTTDRPGASLELTIDAEVQQLVEQELARSVAQTGAAAGIVVALHPSTGEIIACAQQPAFSHQHRSGADALRLHAITDMYEPGSTFKPIVAAAAIAERRTTPEQLYDGHSGQLRLADGRTITDHEPLGWCTLTDALTHSSNIVFAELATQLGKRTLYRYARDFGFGTRTDIELPGEARGMLKLPRQLDASDVLFMGFGYGVACTPLQLACAYAAIANDGVLMQPSLVRQITSSDGETLYQAQPQRIRRVVSPEVSRMIRTMLRTVVERGTGINAHIEGIPIAGKTGTAQQWVEGSYSKRDYTASFIGMVPADQPELVMVVMLDRPRTDIYGGSTAAPLFRRIIAAMLNIPRLALEYRLGISSGTTSAGRDSVIVPDVRGMTPDEATGIMHSIGLGVEGTHLSNGDIVVEQEPAAGRFLRRGDHVRIRTAPLDTLRALPLVGMAIRTAFALAHAAGSTVEIHGRGRVERCTVFLKRNRYHTILYCR
ncbi:MAG: penicillin-binding transpeptidase domain-containing protein [Chlorobi bacterium]|nr:penicillin-binding transpeptidase domain-containing protein [Chlorobiota bacterium]